VGKNGESGVGFEELVGVNGEGDVSYQEKMRTDGEGREVQIIGG
jgi:hypothetical protein